MEIVSGVGLDLEISSVYLKATSAKSYYVAGAYSTGLFLNSTLLLTELQNENPKSLSRKILSFLDFYRPLLIV